MKNNKGYTLVELLAIVTVLSVIIGMSTVAFTQVQNNVLNKDYDNLKSYIETSALQYANDTGLYGIVTIQELIEAGYVTPDDKSDKVFSPVDNEDITCYKVKIEYDDENDTYTTSFMDEEQELVDGKCISTEQEHTLQICRVEGASCTTINENTWFNENIVIGVKDEGVQITSLDNYYEWTPTGGTTPTIDVTSSGRHSVVVKLQNEVNSRTASKSIKIDRTDPTFEKIENNKIYYKDLESGVNQVCFYSINPGTCTNISNADKGCVNATTNGVAIASGAKYACADDKAGNVTDEPEGLLNTISLAINESKSTKTIIDSNKYTKIVIEGIAQNNSKGITAYAFTTSSTTPTSWTNLSSITYDQISQEYQIPGNATYYFWVKYSDETTGNASITINQLISEINTINVAIDETNSGTVKIANSSNYSSIVIKGTAQNNNKGIKAYTFTKSTTTPTSWTNVTGGTTTEQVSGTYNVTENTTYYFWVKYGNDDTGYAAITITQLQTERIETNVAIDETNSGTTKLSGTNYYTAITLKGTAINNTKGIKAYTFTTSSSTPSSWTTITQTKDEITKTKSATSNTTYYFWVKYGDDTTAKKSITVSSLVTSASTTLDFYSESSSTITKTKTISGIKALGTVTVDNGRVSSSSLSDTTVTVKVTGGTEQEDSSSSTSTTSPTTQSATASCSKYSCNSGGKVSGSQCVNNKGTTYYQTTEPVQSETYACTNGKLVGVKNSPSTPCATGYSYDSSYTVTYTVTNCSGANCTNYSNNTKNPYDYFHGKSCSAAISFKWYGKKKCKWDGDYAATCSGGTSYSCPSGYTKVSTTCYKCTTSGYTFNSSTKKCTKTTTTYYSYWEYTATINYYKLK